MTKEMTTCEVADSVQAYKCQTEEQCDDCFMIDHKKECHGCSAYEHDETPVNVSKELESAYEEYKKSLIDLQIAVTELKGIMLETNKKIANLIDSL